MKKKKRSSVPLGRLFLRKSSGNPERGSEKEQLACFRTVYESRDGALCVFEDEQGHLVAVNASRLI